MSGPASFFHPASTLLRASPPASTWNPQLGPLTDLSGTWVGVGFNLIWLPLFNENPSFRLQINSTNETLTISPIGGDIPDRGSVEPDLHYLGLKYLQLISDAETHGQLHVENGMWLNMPPTTPRAYPNQSTVVRLASIPHGSVLVAQGETSESIKPTFQIEDTTPVPADPIMQGMLLSARLPRDLPYGSAQNPNLILEWTARRQKIVRTVTMQIATDFDSGKPPSGGIVNIPFIDQNAQATKMTATFWIESIRQRDGNLTLQLQYSQKVILNFGGVDWPHVSIATLVKQ